MRLLPIVVGLFTSVYGQYGLPIEESTPAAPVINCEGLADGNYADGCTNHYYSCVAGLSYVTKCSANLVYDVDRDVCVYPEECGVEVTTPAAEPSSTTRTPSSTTRAPRPSDIDCSELADGFYSSGCTEYYTICSFGAATVTDCPSGTLFDTVTGHCEHAHECGSPQATVPTGYPVPTTTLPSTTDANDSPFDCQGKEDGDYSMGCSNEFVTCASGTAFIIKCAPGLVFYEGSRRCELSCEETTTVAQDSTPTTTFASSTTPTTTTVSSTKPSPTTTVPSTTAEPVTTTTTVTSGTCQSGQVARLGDCSSKFQRCRCGQWVSAICPGASVFDEVSGLCLYSLPRCFTDLIPGEVPQIHYPSSDSGYSTPTQGYPAYPTSRANVPWEGEQLLSNPFFSPKRHRTHKKESRDKIRQMKGKLRAESKPIRVDDRHTYIQDSFRGSYDPYVPSSSWSVFPRSRVHRMRMQQAMNNLPDSEETEVNPTEPEATSEDPPMAAANIPEVEVEGSGEDMLMPEDDVTRRKRSYGATNHCLGVANNVLVSTGHCLQDFALCRSSIASIAGCPIGDLFDGEKSACVPAAICGVPGSDVCAAPGSTETLATAQPVTTPGVPVASESPVAQSCTDGFSGIISSVCSKDYIVCDNGVEFSMSCPGDLIYDKEASTCSYPEGVVGCGRSQESTTAATVTPYVPVTVTPKADVPVATSSAATPYVPVTATPASSAGSCFTNGLVAIAECSKDFLMCRDGHIQATLQCPGGLMFNGAIGRCDYREAVAGCADSTVPTSTPVSEAHSEAPHSSLPPYVVIDPTTEAPVETTYSSTATPSTTAAVVVETTEEALCAVPISATGTCSPKYQVCSSGVYFEMTCASGLVFNKAIAACDYRELVKDCAEYIIDPTTEEPTTEAATTTTDDVTTATGASTEAVEPSTVASAYGQPQCEYSPARTGIPVGLCSRAYLICSPEGVFQNAECEPGYLFDSDSSVCVDANECGKPKPTTTTFAPDTRCSGLADGSGIVPVDKCSSMYISCDRGVAVSMTCPHNLVYCPKRGKCVRRHFIRECMSTNIVFVTVSSNRSDFCHGREDRLYRDPQDCHAIIQCHGGEMFKQQGCSSGLVFNEDQQRCDYSMNVKGCEKKPQDPQQDVGCNGAAHGAYIADKTDCSVFWRCVWNRLERMSCPSGTLFNPALSVCDWPAAVPHCLAAGGDSTPSSDPIPY